MKQSVRRCALSFKGALALSVLVFCALAFVPHSSVSAAERRVDAWWPVDGAVVQGTQPFKGIVPDAQVGDYYMYWQVDGGGLVKMDDSWDGYPHKYASVDLSGWNWKSDGKYRITFVAKDKSGKEIARKDMNISKQGVTSGATPAPAPAPAPAPIVVKKEVSIAYPVNNSQVSGSGTFKATLTNADTSSYRMYWNVDGGSDNEMVNNESIIDFSGWTWKGQGPYVIAFTAKDKSNGNVIATAKSSITVMAATAVAPSTAPSTPTVTEPVATSPVLSSKLYVDPNSPALAQAIAWKNSRPADAAIMEKIGAHSSGIWLGGWNADVRADVAKAMANAKSQGALPVFVPYNIPSRDCGSYSAGGVASKDAYMTWINKIADGIGAGGKAIVVLEPDALAGMDCLNDQGKADRLAVLSSALDIFKSKTAASVYLDAGHANWIGDADMAQRLNKAGISKAAGFALNVSNYIRTSENVSYGERVSKLTNGARFIVDTSRNGVGGNGEWCNPWGRALGEAPTLSTGKSLVDAYLWVKKPGESDGTCNGGPNAGEWWAEYALGLAKTAGY
ncbi:MAG: glycoside hydrolase family 6 protein [bacterium]|nr:glycoside hydrolase family 6 protein [bacterium]